MEPRKIIYEQMETRMKAFLLQYACEESVQSDVIVQEFAALRACLNHLKDTEEQLCPTSLLRKGSNHASESVNSGRHLQNQKQNSFLTVRNLMQEVIAQEDTAVIYIQGFTRHQYLSMRTNLWISIHWLLISFSNIISTANKQCLPKFSNTPQTGNSSRRTQCRVWTMYWRKEESWTQMQRNVNDTRRAGHGLDKHMTQ